MVGPDSSLVQPNDRVCVDSVRCLAVAMPQQANSGHPGAPVGCAPMAHVLWSYIMNYSPSNPDWWNRDRFVLSNGHGCALLYSMLHLSGYALTLDDLKDFRKLNSRTPGHPESHTPGIEVTTGPLGQGVAQAVGLAIAEAHLAMKYNKPDLTLFDNYSYVICGDGCLQEGVAHEAVSLAGHLKLGKLIVLYDQNSITIDGSTDLCFTENVQGRFEACGWHVSRVEKGDTDIASLKNAVEAAKQVKDRPSLVMVKTTIAYGSLQAGSRKTHGAPLGLEDIRQMRQKFGLGSELWDIKPEVVEHYRAKGKAGDAKFNTWKSDVWTKYKTSYPTEAAEIERRFKGELPAGLLESLPVYGADAKADATRNLSHKSLNCVSKLLPEIFGGSADLTDSNKSDVIGEKDFNAENRTGRYLRFGVREHAMAAIVNGLFAYGAFRPYGATFLNFMGYCWGAARLAALSNYGVLHIATHDSIEMGEDGPTHQPVEILPLLRSCPNLLTIRPADGTECAAAYKIWLQNNTRPTVMALCRSNLPNINHTRVAGVEKGAYVIEDFQSSRPAAKGDKLHHVILAGSGSELHLCLEAKKVLEDAHANVVVRVVSMPCWELFEEQSAEYKNMIFPPSHDAHQDQGALCKLYCEASSDFGWEKYFNLSVGMKTFGASAPKNDLLKNFGFTKENIAKTVTTHLKI